MKWIKLDSVHSTNSYIAAMIREGPVEKELAVIADYQESGRGQGSHTWHSEKGKNLLMSLLLFPAFLSASGQFQLSRVISLAICELLTGEGVEPVIKWPNDILTSQGKIAGILIEHGIVGGNISHSILGTGLNLNQTVFPDFPLRASSLMLEKGIRREPLEMAEKLVEKTLDLYMQLKAGNGESLEQAYLEHLYMLDKPATFTAEGKAFEGVIRGVNSFGELLVETGGKIRSFGHQEVRVNSEW